MTSLTNSNLELKNMFGQFMKMNTASSSGSRTLPSKTITNPKNDLKGITTQSGIAYKGPTTPTSSPPKVVERETDVIKDTVPPTNNESTKDVQHPVVQVETQIPNSKLVVAPVVELVKAPMNTTLSSGSRTLPSNTITNPKEDLKGITTRSGNAYQGPTIPTTSSSLPKVVERETKIETPVPNFEPVIAPVAEPIAATEGELTLRVGKEVITFNIDQTLRYSANYNDLTANRINVIDMACEEYSQ
nr:reverse transcriptase domain-containing protein [Tanacetum cinerariifolium]